MYYQYHVRKHNKNNTDTRIYADVYRHTHQRKPQCALIHSRYQVCEENSGVKLPTLTVLSDLSIHPAYGAAPLWLSLAIRCIYKEKQHTMEFSNKITLSSGNRQYYDKF